MPGRYIDFAAITDYGITFDNKTQILSPSHVAQKQKASELNKAINLNLHKIHYTI